MKFCVLMGSPRLNGNTAELENAQKGINDYLIESLPELFQVGFTADMEELLALYVEGWKKEVASIREHYAKFGDKMPKELIAQLDALEARLAKC